jgi:hypothetical protein
LDEPPRIRGEIGYTLTEADLVWNRACAGAGVEDGDKALAALLSFHGLAMNGGVLHALECLTVEELDAAISGYRFFGFHDVGDLLTEARSTAETSDAGAWDVLEARLDNLYADLVPSDTMLQERFASFLLRNPTHFAPIVPGL